LFRAAVEVVLAEAGLIQPDLLAARSTDFTEEDLPGPPVLAIEVLSPSTRGMDLLLKRERLERAGCAHYWVVDPDEPAITAWSLGSDRRYGEPVQVSGHQEFTAAQPLVVTFRPADLLTP